ncbi:MAG: site-specific integrase [Smithella sp.]
MANKRESTKFPGVYQRNLEPTGNKKDVAFDIAYWHEGRKIFERAGKLSEGYSAKLAADIRSERIRTKRHGDELPHQKKKAITFQKLAEKYLKWSSENKSRDGIDDQSRYDNHLKDRFDNNRLDAITPLDLERMKKEMSRDKMAPKTISHCLALIRGMYNKAAEWNLYQGDNPVKKIKMPTVQNARDRFFSMEEAKLLLKELKRNHQIKDKYKELANAKLHDIALLSLHTGARAGEIFNLKGQDADFQNDLIALRDTKNKETRYAPMTADIKTMLESRQPDNPGDYFFNNKDGEKINEVSNAFQQIVDKLGFNENVADPRQKVVFHTCRHTFASWLAIQGTPLYTIAKLMGHKSISMTERYAHLSPDHKKDAINGLAETLRKHESKIVEIKTEK